MRTRTAWHEAGHAVAYLAHGLSFVAVTVDENGDGEVTVAPRRIPTTAGLVITHAGPITEALHLLGGPDPMPDPDALLGAVEDALLHGGDGDTEEIITCHRDLGITDEQGQVYEDEALRLVCGHWGSVALIAEALCDRVTLTYAEVLGLLDDGNPALTNRVVA